MILKRVLRDRQPGLPTCAERLPCGPPPSTPEQPPIAAVRPAPAVIARPAPPEYGPACAWPRRSAEAGADPADCATSRQTAPDPTVTRPGGPSVLPSGLPTGPAAQPRVSGRADQTPRPEDAGESGGQLQEPVPV